VPPKQKPFTPPSILSLSDLSEVAVLIAAGVELVDQTFNGARVVFNFTDEDGSATETLSAHRNRRLTLPTVDVTGAIKRTKDLAFSTRRDAGSY